jgi:alpha/beta superfamily hydrolase
MKNDLIVKLRELLNTEEVGSIRDGIREIRNDWKAETAKERQIQLEAFTAEEHPEDVEFVYSPHELEGEFQSLLKVYEDRVEEHGKKLAAERQKNLEMKQAILAEMDALIKDEQNIGKAFSSHKALKEQWDAIGDVPGDKYHELQEKWQRFNHEFFYNINIYKTLQDHDLKINLKKKEEMIEEAKNLAEVTVISDLEVLVKKFQREWMNIGPSPRETFKELGDTFFGILRESQNRIQAHYDEIHKHSDENLARKKELVQKMSEILTMEITNAATSNRWTDDVLKLQEEWRTIGWARKKENEEVWQEFRGLCDLFFSKRNALFEEKRGAYKVNKDKKEALIERARAIQNSEDWKGATDELKRLQEEWKAVGGADPREEQKLWQRFRSTCDHFFARKKENYSKTIEEQAQNLVLKQDMLTELEALEITGNKGADLGALKAFGERWHGVGFVPKDKVKEVMDRYNQLLDQKYGQINADREQREMSSFRNRIDSIKGANNSESQIKRERNFMRDKIDKLKHQITQYENNMGIFTGKGAEALRKDIEKKIKATEREIEDIKKKMELLNG